MHSRKIGPFEVSAIGMGCMNISAGYGPADDRESERLMLGALDAGYTFFDTAAMYGMGHSEELIGRTLSHRREEFTLASKCGIFKGENGRTQTDSRPDVLRKTCEDSLRRLQTDVIDLYYLHRIDPNVPVEESVGTLSELISVGKNARATNSRCLQGTWRDLRAFLAAGPVIFDRGIPRYHQPT